MINRAEPTYRCTVCGYRSTNAGFFRMEPGGGLDRPWRVCAGCKPYRPEKTGRHWMTTWVAASIIPMLLSHIVIDRSGGSLLLSLVAVVATVLAEPLSTLFHELGHAAAALLVRRRLLTIEIGSGPPLWAWWIGYARLILRRRIAMGGRVTTVTLSGRPSRWRSMLLLAAGGLANIAVAFWLIGVVADVVPHAFDGGPTTLTAILLGVITANFWSALGSLFPSSKADEYGISNDGAQILKLLLPQHLLPGPVPTEDDRVLASIQAHSTARLYEKAATLAEGLLPGRTSDPYLLATLLDLHTRLYGADIALQRYEATVTFGPPQKWMWDWRPTEGWFLANLACVAAMSGGPHDQPRIETLARAAMAAMGDIAITRGTLGAALCLNGPSEEGEALLVGAVQEADSNLDRADFCLFLARAARKRGDAARAEDFEGLRRLAQATAA